VTIVAVAHRYEYKDACLSVVSLLIKIDYECQLEMGLRKTIHELLKGDLLYFASRWTTPIVSDALFSKALFYYNCWRSGFPYYQLDIDNPKTFNEKICYIKFNIKNPLAPLVADKLRVKDYVAQKVGRQYVIPTLKVFERVEDITIDELPEQFILKLNNGSGRNLPCLDKGSFDVKRAQRFFRRALQRNPYYMSREWHYRAIQSKVFAERFLGPDVANYRFYCAQGEPYVIQVMLDRLSGHPKAAFFDLQWNYQPISFFHPSAEPESISPPDRLDEMIRVSQQLSRDFVFARIDLYEVEGQVFFGEITLHPGGGADPFDSYENDLWMGRPIRLE